MNEKSEELYWVLEEASRQVKEWPDWKRSEESKRELENLARERKRTGAVEDRAG